MMGLLFQREVVTRYFSAHLGIAAPPSNMPVDTWMGVYLPGGERAGFFNVKTVPRTMDGEAGVAIASTAKLQLGLLGEQTEIFITGTAWASTARGLREMNFRIRSGDHDMQVDARVEEEFLHVDVETGGETFNYKLPVARDLALASGFGTTALNVSVLEPGDEAVINTFDPMTFSLGEAHVKCVGQETLEVEGEPIAVKVIETTVGGFASKAWVSDQNEVIRAEAPFGFVLRKVSQSEALMPLSGEQSADLIELAAVRPEGLRPVRGARRMVFHIDGVTSDTPLPLDAMQTRDDNGTYAITVPPPPEDSESILPSDELEDALKSSALIPVDHPAIVAQVAEIVKEGESPWQDAQRIYQWVYENIEKKPVLSIPSALDVLETREGDCNEHTVLYTALARAAGLPTRIALGIVWSPELDGFYYHAWPEVHIGEWYAIDPTLGQPQADATHIKLVNGDIEKWPELLPYLGKLQVEIVEVEEQKDGSAQ